MTWSCCASATVVISDKLRVFPDRLVRKIEAVAPIITGMRLVALSIATLVVGTAMGCDDPVVPSSSFYDERIQPIVEVGCAQQLNGCHVDEQGRATGNLDLSSFDALMQRRDVLPAFGPYTNGLILLKGGEDIVMNLEVWDPDPTSGSRVAMVETDIRHAAGQLLETGSAGQRELKRWIEESSTRTGVPDETLVENQGDCSNRDAVAFGFDPDADPEPETFNAFTSGVESALMNRCAGGNCHGTTVADFYLKCADGGANTRWNYWVALSHVTDIAPSRSGLLRRPLSVFRGGTFHEGGNVIGSTEDPDYQTLFDWVNLVAENHPELTQDPSTDPGLRYFANRVQPVLARKGCMFMNCHSNTMFHDLRLRAGDQGVWSRIATHRNHEISLLMLALESPDVNDSRLVGKNLRPRDSSASPEGLVGIEHRGGSLFEDFGVRDAPPTDADCAMFDADNGDLNEVPAYCIIRRWHEIEREEAIANGEINPGASPIDAIVYVSRPTGVGGVRDFDTFRGGADLRSAPATVDAAGAVTLGGSTSLLGSCPVGAGGDIRNPAVSFDASQIAFAARASASDPFRIYTVNPDGSGCAAVSGIDAGATMENGILLHDFDPAWAPDGRLVFASTRGNIDGNVSYSGPTTTPAAGQPNANLFIQDADGSVRQLTFLLNQEVAPAFMLDGRIIMTGEKREPDFHQLALRRQNLDGGDYHPLFAQRESVGFRSATEVIELPNRNFMFVASHLPCSTGVSPCSADGAGALVMVNRSIGPDQDDRPDERDYIHSMYLTAPGAFGGIQNVTATDLTAGVFRSPSPLVNGRVVAACGDGDLGGSPAYTLCEIEVFSGNRRDIGGEPGMANVEPVAVMRRPVYPVFESKPDEANGNSQIFPDRADRSQVDVVDFPLLATLLFANTREGRPINFDVGGVRVFEALPPEAGGGEMVSDGFGTVFRNYRDMGFVPTFADGSLSFVIPGGMPVVLQPTDNDGNALMFGEGDPFAGEMIQREQMQFYPGELLSQSFRRDFFNGLCGTCHGSISGRELDSAVNVDVLTQASMVSTMERDPVDLR